MKRNRFKSWISQLGFVFFIFSLCIMSSCKKTIFQRMRAQGLILQQQMEAWHN